MSDLSEIGLLYRDDIGNISCLTGWWPGVGWVELLLLNGDFVKCRWVEVLVLTHRYSERYQWIEISPTPEQFGAWSDLDLPARPNRLSPNGPGGE